jgi:antitoxin HicB
MRYYRVIIEPDEDGVYIATVPSVPGVVDQGDTPEEAYERVKESLYFALDSMIEDNEEIPPDDSEHREIRGIQLAV